MANAVRGQGLATAPAGAAAPARRPWLALLVTVVVWFAAVWLIWALVRHAIRYPPRMGDLRVYRTAGRQVLNGKLVYSRVPEHELASLGRSYLVFTYPPVAAILAAPLALLSWPVAQLAWVPMVYLPLGVTIWFSFRPLLARAGRYAAAALGAIFILCLYLWPMLQEIRFGQVDIALAALCLADVATRGPRWPRGLMIGLAAAIKLTPGVFILYLLVTGQRRAAAIAAATMAALTGTAWLLIPRNSAYYWTSAVLNLNRLGPASQISDQSIRAMLLRASPGHLPAGLWLGLAVIVTVAGLAGARTAAQRGNGTAGAAIVGLLAVLVSPVSWIHHLVWVVVAIGAILGDGRSWRRWLAAAGTAAFFILHVPYQGTAPPFEPSAPDLLEQLVQDGYGIAAAVLMAILTALPRPRSAARGGPATAVPGSGRRPAPAPHPGCSMASGG